MNMDQLREFRAARSGFVLPVLAGLLLSACMDTKSLDWDLRNNGGATSGAVEQATGARPTADAQGVISYPGYQVVVARRGDTVASVAARLGVPADQLASYNALAADDSLRQGEVLALPVRVAASDVMAGGTSATTGGIDVAAIATTALDRADTGSAQTGAMIGSDPAPAAGALPFATQGSGPEPVRYQVKRGETAFTIARSFNISAKALADWNGLGPDLMVREGQFLIIPTPADISRLPADAQVADATAPGEGTPRPRQAPSPQQSTAEPDGDESQTDDEANDPKRKLQVAPVVNKQIAAHAVIATRQRGTDDEETQGRPNAYAAAGDYDDDLAEILADDDAAEGADRERAAAANAKPPGRTRGQRGGNRGKKKR
jgi:LysM repeat protein